MKVLVTGGAGYVGSTLVQVLLGEGYGVRVLDSLMHGGRPLLPVWSHPAFEFVRGDVRNPDHVRRAVAGVDAVVHLAAIVGDPACAANPAVARATNQDAALMVLQESRTAGVRRLVFASTCSNYGKMKDPEGMVNEETELAPVSLYAETKVAVEHALLDRTQTGELCATPLRLSTVYGVSPRMRFDLTVNEFTMEMVARKALKVYGEQFWRPYVHVRDAAAAVMLVLRSPEAAVKSQVFNVGANDQNFTKKDLVEMISPHAPGAVVEYVKKTEDPRDYRVSFERVSRVLGFRARKTVREGIAEVAALVKDGIISDFDNPQYRN